MNRNKKLCVISVLCFVLFLFTFAGMAQSAQVKVYLLDLSGSFTKSIDGRSHVEENIDRIVVDIKATAKRNDHLYILGFARNSKVLVEAGMPPKEGASRINILKHAEKIKAKLQDKASMWRSNGVDHKSTDVIGALMMAGRLMADVYGMPAYEKRSIHIFSDMVDTEQCRITVAGLKEIGSHKKYIARIPKEQLARLRLSKVNVFCDCPITDGTESLKSFELETVFYEMESLWKKVFSVSGANLREYRIIK